MIGSTVASRKREPCSALRRSLLHAPVRRRFWLQPFGLARVLAQRPPALGERSYGAETGVMRRG